MCLNPTLIPNPWLNVKSGNWICKDTVSQYIPVPCGHCSECMATRALGIRQRCELEEMVGHPFMLMLSYSNSMLPTITLSNGKDVSYVDFKDFTNMVKRIRKRNLLGRDFRYLAISERGGKKGRPHIHAIIYVQKYPDDNFFDIINLESKLHDVFLSEWKRNVAVTKSKSFESYGNTIPNTRNPIYKPLCKPVEYVVCGKRFGTFGVHYISPSALDGTSLGATAYVSKYFLKRDDFTIKLQRYLKLNLSEDEYTKVWNLVKTRYISSLNFGFGLYSNYNAKTVSRSERLDLLSELPTFKHVADSLSRSVHSQDRPRYYELESGKPIPLSRYFYHIDNLYTPSYYYHFAELRNKYGDYVSIDDRDTLEKLYQASIKDRQIVNKFSLTDFTDLM